MREKMKAKYIEEYIQKVFCKLAGWHLVTSQRINLFIDNFQGFWLIEHLPMASSGSYTNNFKSTCEIVAVCAGWNPLFVYEISSLPEVFYKKGVLKSF